MEKGITRVIIKYGLLIITVIVSNLLLHSTAVAQTVNKKQAKKTSSSLYAPAMFKNMHWRCIGPWRGGRSLAVCGVAGDNKIYYSGAVGGGVWKTMDGGKTWNCISDTTFKSSSVGAITVAPSDANIIYVGMGESEQRNNISFGDGMYKSLDAGRTWKKMGLDKTYAIANIAVHPQNPDIVFVSAHGNIWQNNNERGVYRSKDGGNTWEKVLYINDSTGCADIKMDPVNPRILFASMWVAYRRPYEMVSGGKTCGLYKSTDGGDTWVDISKKPGMPEGLSGKIIVSISPANHNRIYAMIENEHGGLFSSNNGGETWQQINTDNDLKQRPWYFSQVFAGTQSEDDVIVLNVEAFRSKDGGHKFERIRNHHGDNHDCWINPHNADNFIIGDDGGAEITYDGGSTFTELNIPTAQFYHVQLDNDFLYNVYGAQQDNSSLKIASTTDGYLIGDREWQGVAGGEAGYIVPDPLNSKITYGGEYDGQLSKYNEVNHQYQAINPWPEGSIGSGGNDKKYRFNWTYPIMFSSHNPAELFVTSNFVHVSMDGGNSWKTISPDLTRNEIGKQQASGGPISKDNSGADIYNSIFAFAESPVTAGVLWAGADDGLVHISTDNGSNWNDVTPSWVKEYGLISIIEPSHYNAGVCYIAANRYKVGDNKPYLFKTTDYGKTWQLITNGIPEGAYTRVIREDPFRKGLLYAGTETGIYISFDDGANWQPIQFNMPNTPVHDMQIEPRYHDLVVATHGRSFWILDDLTPFYQLDDSIIKNKYSLLKPREAYKLHGGSFYSSTMQVGENAPHGVIINYYLQNKPSKELRLVFYDEKGDSIISYSNIKDKKGEPIKISKEFYPDSTLKRPGILDAGIGFNRFVWDMRYPDAINVDGTNIMWSGSIIGPVAKPGNYSVKMLVGDTVVAKQNFKILKDPRVNVTDADLAEQFDLLKKISDKLSECHKAINDLKSIRNQVNDFNKGIIDTAQARVMKNMGQKIVDSLGVVEGKLMQPKAKAGEDVLNYPMQLNDKMAGLGGIVSSADTKPTKQSYEAFDDLSKRIDAQIQKLDVIKKGPVADFNKKAAELNKPAIELKKKDKDAG